ncbi:phosphate ABC transporter substrate-binding protein PstS [Nocardioides sp. NPDC051685]|uniref:phosphate ABC transporter substrate-binding protein PstS n=1 Tax=Nocardioides sp. NPDC051685 TaxID=3364334 RepID=UPI00114D9B7C
MNTTSLRRALVPGITAAALALAISACGAANEQGSDSDGEGTLSGTIKGGGASSQEKGQAAWVAGIQDANPDLSVVYEPVGSGSGREGFISGGYLFAGTDSALNDDEGELSGAKKKCGGDPIQVPAYVSPIAVAFNVEGVDELKLDAATLSGIFSGKITKWNDSAITALNPDAKLPDTAITPVHRSDDSGTQENFTDYLSKAGGWAEEPDGEWPASIKVGEGADGTSGVVTAMQGAGYIGFMDESAARENDLTVASIKVGEDYVEPTAEAAAKILAASKPAGLSDNDMAVEVARTTTEAGVYPVVLVSYLLACPTYENAEDAANVKGYLEYILSEDGQKVSAEEAGSAPLDRETADKALDLVGAIK